MGKFPAIAKLENVNAIVNLLRRRKSVITLAIAQKIIFLGIFAVECFFVEMCYELIKLFYCTDRDPSPRFLNCNYVSIVYNTKEGKTSWRNVHP